MPNTPILALLLSGNPIEFEGVELFPVLNSKREVITGENLNPGDTYIAQRGERPPQLLTADRINFALGCVHPEGVGYPFDFHECVRVTF